MQQQNPIGLQDSTKIANTTWASLKHSALLSDKTAIRDTVWAKIKKAAMKRDYLKSEKFVSNFAINDFFCV